jgi:hypothetical protein
VLQSTLLFSSSTEMTARLHALVQYADDFDQPRLDRAIVEDVHRLLDLRLEVLAAGMSDMKAADAGIEFAAASCKRALRIGATLRIADARIAA